MAIEMFAGKTGDRLIARLPVAEGSYADVSLETKVGHEAVVRLVYLGAYHNGYPALSPELATLDSVDPAINTRIQAGLQIADGVISGLDEILASTKASLTGDFGLDALQAGLLSAATERDIHLLREFAEKPPICPRIMPGQMMQLALPKALYGQGNVVDLGVVDGIGVHNSDNQTG